MKPNKLDKLIGWISPTAELRRVAARARVQAAYEGAKLGRRTGGWLTTGRSANAEIGQDLAKLRERASDLTRNNHFARNLQGKWRDAIVGPGILCRWEDPTVQAIWDRWSTQCSADGLPHFEAVQSLVCGAEWERGEVLIRLRLRRPEDGIWPPFQVQIIESDYVDTSKTMETPTGSIIQGVEFNRVGRRTGYWLFGQHPGDVVNTGVRMGMGLSSAFVPAAEVLHIYKQDRPGQVRGVPRLAAVMLRMRDLDDWEDCELVRKRTEAALAAFVSSPEGENFAFTDQVLDQNGNLVETLEPGMVLKGKPGESVTFTQPNYAGGYNDYKTSISRDVAAGVEVPFELMTGDYSKSNYSSSRMGVVAFERTVESAQWNVIIPLACEPVAQEFLRVLAIVQRTPVNGAHEWQPPEFNLLDREAESRADQIELQLGTTAWMDAVSRKGLDPVKQLEKIRQHAEELKELGVDFFNRKTDSATAGNGGDDEQSQAPTE